MRNDPGKHFRRSIRLRGYDYSRAGSYFVTIVSFGREPLFGEIRDGVLRPSAAGLEVQASWMAIDDHFPTVAGDAFILMPNHVHFVVSIVGGESLSEQGAETAPLQRSGDLAPTLGQIAAFFKYQSTKRINAIEQTFGERVWQRNYYEHVIRDDAELVLIRGYIATNPLRWDQDRENPANIKR